MRNTLVDLNNHLFEQLERLNDDELTIEDIKKEMARSKAIKGIADKIIDNAKIVLEAEKVKLEYRSDRYQVELPSMLDNKKGK